MADYYVYVPRWLIGQLKIFRYTFFVLMMTGLIFIIIFKRVIKKNWSVYRCHPAITPISGLFGHDPKETREVCLADRVKATSDVVMQPYSDVLESQKQNSIGMMDALKGIRGVMSSFKENLMDSVKTILEKIKNIGATVQFLMMKIQAIFQKILALYITLLYFAWSLLKGLEALVRDPKVLKSQGMIEDAINLIDNPPKFDLGKIGDVAKDGAQAVSSGVKSICKRKPRWLCCFGKDTIISSYNGPVYIKDLCINDKLMNETVVIGKLKVKQPKTVVHEIGSTLVTGDHLCYHNNKWKEVSKILNKKSSKYINTVHCIVTSTNLIPTPDKLYRDYEETGDQNVQSIISKIILNSLGNSNAVIRTKYEQGEKTNCLLSNTSIRMKSGNFIDICKLNIDDETSCGKVCGIYICDTSLVNWRKIQNHVLSANIIVKSSNIENWEKVYNLSNNMVDINKSELGYHIITETGKVELSDNLFIRDLKEIDNKNTNDLITDVVLKHINNT